MTILLVRDLMRGITRDDALADLLVLAQSLGFTGSSFRIGSRDRFKILAMAEVASRLSVQISLLAANGYNSTAWGQGLTNFSRSRFDNQRVGAVKTQGTVLLTDTGSIGPRAITVGEFMFTATDQDGERLNYRNITGGTLLLDDTLEVTVEAESGGSKYNVDVDTVVDFSPVVAGISCSNPADPTDWVTRPGTDGEPDESLQDRNVDKWATLGGNAPYNAYDYWARVATTNDDGTGDAVGITRTHVNDDNPGGPGTVYIYIADEDGTATAGQVTDVQEYIDARKPRTAIPTVFAASAVNVAIVATFHCATGQGVALTSEIEDAITDYFNSLPVGGEDIGETFGKVLLARIYETAMAIDGVRNFRVTNASTDPTLQPEEVAVPVLTITPIEI